MAESNTYSKAGTCPKQGFKKVLIVLARERVISEHYYLNVISFHHVTRLLLRLYTLHIILFLFISLYLGQEKEITNRLHVFAVLFLASPRPV